MCMRVRVHVRVCVCACACASVCVSIDTLNICLCHFLKPIKDELLFLNDQKQSTYSVPSLLMKLSRSILSRSSTRKDSFRDSG